MGVSILRRLGTLFWGGLKGQQKETSHLEAETQGTKTENKQGTSPRLPAALEHCSTSP